MEFTSEQAAIVNSTGNIKIDAIAGSGKTTTLIEYARTRPSNSKILYLAFNKSVKLEAIRKFTAQGIANVKVETAHSLAFKHVVYKHDYKVRPHGYKTSEIVELLNLHGNGEKHTEYVVANHINKFTAYFCNSDREKIQDLNYLDIVSDKRAKKFVKSFYNYIEWQSSLFLDKMDKGEIEVTHDFYLKKFQLSNPRLHFDYILFDEGQDASPAMLNVFLKQNATKVIIGDTHQQIYSWRLAVNSLEKADFKTFHLTTSFRFSEEIANLAMGVLKWKNYLEQNNPVVIKGVGMNRAHKVKAVLARTNLGLLLKVIEFVIEKKKLNNIYFEGNINSYTYADDGTSLYDVLKLYNGNPQLVKDKMIKAMKNINELVDYIDKTEDVQLGMMVEIVRKYGNRIPGIIQEIKAKHIDNDEKENAQMIFSTVHRCKGMEYDSIQLVNDFITKEKLEKKCFNNNEEESNSSRLNEEINLLYVALTRTKNSIYIPEDLLPDDIQKSPQIHILRKPTEKEKNQIKAVRAKIPTLQKIEKGKRIVEKVYSVDELGFKHKDAYNPWSDKLDHELTIMYWEGISLSDIAAHFGRSKGAILSRIRKLQL
jgi:superfamily I DNA/RNA helicase